ncbi:hypothetical protein FRB99_000097 [Tulasnella sp. 403]|nr:hypothetical protein FRB99_000097 [Tulasnella sp. 403]
MVSLSFLFTALLVATANLVAAARTDEASSIDHVRFPRAHLATRTTGPKTNAERFAAGLPPLPPTRRSRGRLAPRASPGVVAMGTIEVRYVDTDALFLSYPATIEQFGFPYDVVHISNNDGIMNYQAVTSYGDIGPSSGSWAILLGDPPLSDTNLPNADQDVGQGLEYYESYIWDYSPRSGRLVPHWTDFGGNDCPGRGFKCGRQACFSCNLDLTRAGPAYPNARELYFRFVVS